MEQEDEVKKDDKVFVKAIVERTPEKGDRMVRVRIPADNTPVWVRLDEIAQIPDIRAYLDKIEKLKEDFDNSRAERVKEYKGRLGEVLDRKQKEALSVGRDE